MVSEKETAGSRSAALQEKVDELQVIANKARRPVMVNAECQTDNRREEALMELMQRCDPQVLQEAFEAELQIEKEKTKWLEDRLATTNQMLHTLAENVNAHSGASSTLALASKQPRFMRSTHSTRTRKKQDRSRKTEARSSKNQRRRHQETIHETLRKANNVRCARVRVCVCVLWSVQRQSCVEV